MSHRPAPSTPARPYWVAALDARGDLRSCDRYEYALLERVPGASEIIGTLASHLYRSPDNFEVTLGGRSADVSLRFTAPAPTVGIGVLRDLPAGRLISITALATGIDRRADSIVFDVLQTHLARELRNTPHEPAFDLVRLSERPIVATFDFASPPGPEAQRVAALADRCLGAAFFRYHQLA